MNPVKQQIHDLARQLPDKERADFMMKEASDALVNLGPEAARKAAGELSTLIDIHPAERSSAPQATWQRAGWRSFSDPGQATGWASGAGSRCWRCLSG